MPRESKTRITIIVLVAGALAVGAVLGRWWAAPQTSRLRFAISFPAAQSDQPLDGRVDPGRLGQRPAGAALREQRLPARHAAGVRHRRRRPRAGPGRRHRRAHLRVPAEEPRRAAAGRLLGAGRPPSLRDLPPVRRSRRQAPDGSWRRAALEPGPGQPVQRAGQGAPRPAHERRRSPLARPGRSRRSRRRRTPSTSSTSASRAICSRSSGAGRCASAPSSCCPRASTSIRTRGIR